MVRGPESDADVRNPRRVAPSAVKDDAKEAGPTPGAPILVEAPPAASSIKLDLPPIHTMFKLIVALCASSAVAFQSAMPMARAT